jgi:hypothetical protein
MKWMCRHALYSRLLFMLIEQSVDGCLDGLCGGTIGFDDFLLLGYVTFTCLKSVLVQYGVPSRQQELTPATMVDRSSSADFDCVSSSDSSWSLWSASEMQTPSESTISYIPSRSSEFLVS